MSESGPRVLVAGEHASQLGDALRPRHPHDPGAGGLRGGIRRRAIRRRGAGCFLDDDELRVGPGGDLREMSDHHHLVTTCQACESAADLTRGASSDTRIDLIEDEGALVLRGAGSVRSPGRIRVRRGIGGCSGGVGGVRQDDLQGQHDAGQLTS